MSDIVLVGPPEALFQLSTRDVAPTQAIRQAKVIRGSRLRLSREGMRCKAQREGEAWGNPKVFLLLLHVFWVGAAGAELRPVQ